MKINKIVPLLLILAVLSGCTAKTAEIDEVTEVVTTEVVATEETRTAISVDSSALRVPFTDYTFELNGANSKYMVIISKGEHSDEIAVTVEDNLYQSKEYVITSPAGYHPVFPVYQDTASSIVTVIENDIDDRRIPDIMQFIFYLTSEENESNPENVVYVVSRMYMIDKSGELKLIPVVNDDGETRDYIDRTQLYYSEPDKFIYQISVDDTNVYDENGELKPIGERVKVKTFTFDYNTPCFKEGYEEVSEENPLYFGYAYWATANSVAQYFITTTFNISDWENYIEMPNPDDNTYKNYYFKIDDSRFKSTDDMKKHLETIFTQSIAAKIFAKAPQRYTDIDGELYGIAGDGGYDLTLGELTFMGMEITENKMVFRSRQKKYDEVTDAQSYTDGGNFVIEKQDDGQWKVSQYRYPYSPYSFN